MKVFVGVSGGVDSSVTALLLKEQGHDVTGVFMKNWTRDIGGFVCPWREDLTDAKRVAVRLGIDFKVFDFEDEYRHKVVDYMLDEYKQGRTPNPDVMCNQEIKFKLFLDTSLENGAETIATGHYAQIKDGQLFKGKDASKDQSYFLYRVSEEALAKSLMPVGGMDKTKVRQRAESAGLITADKPDSMGICFVGEVGIKDFLQEFIDTKPGPIIDANTGEELGEHDGAQIYTIGQRHGLDVGGGLPYYVSRKDIKTNTVFVTNQIDDDDLWYSHFTVAETHWINDAPKPDEEYSVQVRYRSKEVPCTVNTRGQEAEIKLETAQRALTPGQSAVIYEGNRVVGGGIISS